jgi:hypothetical protein
MKTLDIALKDLLRSIRGPTFLAISFLVPLLVAAIFYFAFGGLASDDGGFDWRLFGGPDAGRASGV